MREESLQKVTMERIEAMMIQSNGRVLSSVSLQIQGMNTTIEKMKDDGDDRYNKMNERITTMEKMMSVIEGSDKKVGETKVRVGEYYGTQEDQNQGRAVATGLHKQEVEYQVRETIVEIGMSTEKFRIKCPAKPITHAFIHFTDNDQRNKYVRSANMLKTELRGRKIKLSPSTDAEERFHQQRLGYIKCCIHTRHDIPLASISMNRTRRHVSVDGQTAVRTC